ncbi:oxygenase MpaB family protein [Rhodococcus kronopolitis]|uniref:Oxygenase MpaB family protein n=1 Tax=Rhodococcus kronopolitis TaxID=1460226 RepID=A0ABV9FWT0_9NOCA
MSRRAAHIEDLAGEAVMLAAGGRAILLQIANEGVGHGVADHSDFAYRSVDRLRTTMTYIYAVVYGTDAERAAVVRMVNKAHVKVRAENYNAFDPALQLWVAATLYESAVSLYERVFGPLDDADADELYREYAVLGTALQVPPGMWPRDRVAFAGYWKEQLDRVEVDAKVRATSRDLFHPAAAPMLIRANLPAYRWLTTGLLPAQLREQFELPWTARDQRRFDRVMTLISWVYPRIPSAVRHAPRTVYLWDMRRRLRTRGGIEA